MNKVHQQRFRRVIPLLSIISEAPCAARWAIVTEYDRDEFRYMRQWYPDFDRELIWYTHENIESIVPFVVAVFYHYALWGKLLKYAHEFLRALMVLVSQSSGSTQLSVS